MVEIYCDSADVGEMSRVNHLVSGFTTNPTLMRKAGVKDYKSFAKIVIDAFHKPVSLEVIADDFNSMQRQAELLHSWGATVKIPISNSLGEPSDHLIAYLVSKGVQVNVTAVMTLEQVERLIALRPAIISIFAGRIADTGIDPHNVVYAASYLKTNDTKILWASTRELLNLLHAHRARADIITMTPDLLKKLELKGKDLNQFSLETVRMFKDDAEKAGYTL